MIKIKDMVFGYGKQRIFDSFNLEIEKGETVLITGINGTGKTTLLRLLAGALTPVSGTVQYDPGLGDNPRMKIGFISDRMRLYEDMTLAGAIRYHSSAYDISKFDMSLVELLRLPLDKKIKDLSVGQKIIFHLGLILSARPDILLIDEVIHSIDAFLREVFLKTLIELMAQRPVTVVMVNLNFHDIEKLPQRVILLRNGAAAVDEPIDSLKQKVKKVICTQRLPEDLPVLFSSSYSDAYEYYLYPFDETVRQRLTVEADEGKTVQVKDLNLSEIIKAFIGGEYV
jgi:ABC-2 type transport system ATP-binding protein